MSHPGDAPEATANETMEEDSNAALGDIPQGLKPLNLSGPERPKAKALGYLEALTR